MDRWRSGTFGGDFWAFLFQVFLWADIWDKYSDGLFG